jgi:hypothetical protein
LQRDLHEVAVITVTQRRSIAIFVGHDAGVAEEGCPKVERAKGVEGSSRMTPRVTISQTVSISVAVSIHNISGSFL